MNSNLTCLFKYKSGRQPYSDTSPYGECSLIQLLVHEYQRQRVPYIGTVVVVFASREKDCMVVRSNSVITTSRRQTNVKGPNSFIMTSSNVYALCSL